MSVVARTLDGEHVAERGTAIGDNHRQIRAHCGKDRALWLEACYLSLIDSGWNEQMLGSLQLNPQGTWYRVVKDSVLRPADTKTPRELARWANSEPGNWERLVLRTLISRGWTLDMLATLLSISFATAFRWNRDLKAVDWYAIKEFEAAIPDVPDEHMYSGIQATREAAERLRTLAERLGD